MVAFCAIKEVYQVDIHYCFYIKQIHSTNKYRITRFEKALIFPEDALVKRNKYRIIKSVNSHWTGNHFTEKSEILNNIFTLYKDLVNHVCFFNIFEAQKIHFRLF